MRARTAISARTPRDICERPADLIAVMFVGRVDLLRATEPRHGLRLGPNALNNP